MHQVYNNRCSGISSSSNEVSKSFNFRSVNNLQLQLPLVVKHQQLVMEVFIRTTSHHHHLWAPSYLMHFCISSKSCSKRQWQQQLTKYALQQAQLIYANAFMQAQAQAQHVANSTSFASTASGFNLQRHPNEQQPQCIGNLFYKDVVVMSSGHVNFCDSQPPSNHKRMFPVFFFNS